MLFHLVHLRNSEYACTPQLVVVVVVVGGASNPELGVC